MSNTKPNRPSEEAYRRAAVIVRKMAEWGNQTTFTDAEWDHYFLESAIEEVDMLAQYLQPLISELEMLREKVHKYHRRAQSAERTMGAGDPMVWKFQQGVADEAAKKILAARHFLEVMKNCTSYVQVKVVLNGMEKALTGV